MISAVRALARPGIAAGFGLAGIPVIESDSPQEAALRIEECLADPSIGVILVEELLHQHLPDDLQRRLARRPLPMVVPFPGMTADVEPEAAESYIVALLRQVIGYRVRLR